MVIGWFERHDKISWVITIFGAIAIFYLSTITFGPGIPRVNLFSIFYHFFAFFFFALFLQISSLKGQKKYLVFIIATALAILYGISDELHQFFVPGRSCNLFDVGTDTLGIMLASMSYLVRIELKNKKHL